MKQSLIVMITITMLTGCFSREPEKTGKEGKPIPELNLLLTDSTTWLNIGQSNIKNPVVLFYFSPNCPYCKAQTKEIIEDIDKLKDIQFYFISSFPIPMLKAYNEEYNLAQYPNIITGKDTANAMGEYFEIVGVPYMAIYGKDKKLKKSFMGGKLYTSQIKKITQE
jgi:thiol-disulfide isomerase/thioredoxin